MFYYDFWDILILTKKKNDTNIYYVYVDIYLSQIEAQLWLDMTFTGTFCSKCNVQVNIQECIYIKRIHLRACFPSAFGRLSCTYLARGLGDPPNKMSCFSKGKMQLHIILDHYYYHICINIKKSFQSPKSLMIKLAEVVHMGLTPTIRSRRSHFVVMPS